MSEDASFSHFPSSYEDRNSRKSHFVAIFFIIILVVIVILVGLYFLGATKTGSLKPIKTPPPTPTATQQAPTTTPTPTPLTLDRSKLKIVVLNGSGVAGAAKGISSHLDDLGYTVKKVGNAEKFDYKGVTIVVTKANKNYGDLLKKDLTGKADTVTVTIDDTITDDAQVIVGK